MALEIATHVNLARIEEAYHSVRKVAHRTPLFTSQTFDAMAGCAIHLKAENLQKTGSFKVRGAYLCLSRFSPEQKARGVVTASAGNHAQGIALGARLNGMKATVFMPTGASIAKVQATRGYGAEVRLVGAIFDEAVQAAKAFAEETGAEFVSAFDHDDIIAGQGTIGLELLEDLPDLETVIVPVGGGGLMSGVAIALKERNPHIRVVGVQAEGAPALVKAWQAHELVATPSVKTIADGIAIKYPAERTFHYIAKYVDEMVTVSDEDTANTIVQLLERTKLVVEGAGAVGLAALLTGRIAARGKTAVILSGGNIDTKLLSSLIERHMLRAQRYARLFTAVDDKPGSLAKLLKIVADGQGNLIEVNHNRASASVPLGGTGVEIQIETRDGGHIEEIVGALRGEGYPVQVMP
ncbi:MAG: threonine ammonia-lyase [Candidatus Sericytochromatia bacterium]|nr:threonine ammonia-lyase [Candidatus Sericytochromatia bacterium]